MVPLLRERRFTTIVDLTQEEPRPYCMPCLVHGEYYTEFVVPA